MRQNDGAMKAFEKAVLGFRKYFFGSGSGRPTYYGSGHLDIFVATDQNILSKTVRKILN